MTRRETLKEMQAWNELVGFLGSSSPSSSGVGSWRRWNDLLSELIEEELELE